MWLRLSLLPLALLAACDPPVACTDLAAASSLIHVVGEDGTTPLVAEITAVDADGNDVIATCAGSDVSACTDWIVGYEVQGEITITADATDECGNYGTGVVTVTVEVDDSECPHVIQEEATLVVDDWTDLGCV